ncbi:MAG: hypothetical protein Q9209_007891 [Squamulea sp. 1 TL-2023]
MSRPPPHLPALTSASQSAGLAYVPPFGTQSEEFLLAQRQPPIQQQEGLQQQQQQSSPPNPRKRKAPRSPPMAGTPSGLTPGYGPSTGFAAQAQQGEQQSEISTQGSATKKSRTNTPWTPAEEQRLKTMRDAGNTWSEIAKVRFLLERASFQPDGRCKTFPNRTEGSVKKHWYKVGDRYPCTQPRLMMHQDMHYADFAEDEVKIRAGSERERKNHAYPKAERSLAGSYQRV